MRQHLIFSTGVSCVLTFGYHYLLHYATTYNQSNLMTLFILDLFWFFILDFGVVNVGQKCAAQTETFND